MAVTKEMRGVGFCLALAMGLLLAGCHEQPRATPSLAGTSWQLAELRALDSAGTTVRPNDPASYELEFGADGSLAMRLDCNRGMARWNATPTPEGYGDITISAGAMTRAMCPPGSLDNRIAQEIGLVRRYSIEDGRLMLILNADHGMQVWSPKP